MPRDTAATRWVRQSRRDVVVVGIVTPLACLAAALLIPKMWVLFAVAGGIIFLLAVQTYVQHTKILRQIEREP